MFLKIESGLGAMLAHWGVKANEDLVLDLDRCGVGRVPVRRVVPGQGVVETLQAVPWPRFILTKKANYSAGVARLRELDKVAFIDALSLSPVDPLPPGIPRRAEWQAGAARIPPVRRKRRRPG